MPSEAQKPNITYSHVSRGEPLSELSLAGFISNLQIGSMSLTFRPVSQSGHLLPMVTEGNEAHFQALLISHLIS